MRGFRLPSAVAQRVENATYSASILGHTLLSMPAADQHLPSAFAVARVGHSVKAELKSSWSAKAAMGPLRGHQLLDAEICVGH